jgi:hypothetical protein
MVGILMKKWGALFTLLLLPTLLLSAYHPHFKALMYVSDNSTPSVIDSVDDWHAGQYFTTQYCDAALTCDVGEGSTAITAVADAGGGIVTVTAAGHGLADNDIICITGTTDYNGVYLISGVTDDTYNVTAAYTSSQSGNGGNPSTITCWNDGHVLVAVSSVVEPDSTTAMYQFGTFKETELITGSQREVDSSATSAVSYMGVQTVVEILPGQRIWLGARNITNADDLTFRYATFLVQRD